MTGVDSSLLNLEIDVLDTSTSFYSLAMMGPRRSVGVGQAPTPIRVRVLWLRPSSGTAMSNSALPRLPPEILDSVVDFLFDDSRALSRCCLVSKSWIPRTRRHLFATIRFKSPADLETWEKIFPDPEISPENHARALFVCLPGRSGWIQFFQRCMIDGVESHSAAPG